MTSHPPPPPPPPYGFGGYPPPPPGYGYPPPYPPPPGFISPPAPQPAAQPVKSRRARLFDALTILFEIVIVLGLLAYVMARMSGNENRIWTSRIEAAQALHRAAVQASRSQLAAAAPLLKERGGPAAHDALTLDSAAWLTTLESILDEQSAIEALNDEARKQSRAAALLLLQPTASAKTGATYHVVIAALTRDLRANTPPPEAAVRHLLAESAAPLRRLTALQSAGSVLLDRLPELAAGPAFAKRRSALHSLLVLLAARAGQPAGSAADTAELRTRAGADRRLLIALASVYLHTYLPADLERAGGATAQDAGEILQLCVHQINQASLATSRGGRTAGGDAGQLAAGLEQALPSPADLTDRVIARLIADHLAQWRLGQSTALWTEPTAPKTGDWSGTDPFGATAAALLNLSANLHAIDGRPVTAEITLRNADGSSATLKVSDWLARLRAQADPDPDAAIGAELPDGRLQVGGCNLAAVAAGLDRELRIARAQLHLLQINAQLHDHYSVTQEILPAFDPQPIDPLTGRPYLYKPYENDWNLFSDFGETDPAATPHQLDDPKKDMKATLRDGLVIR